MQLFYEGVDITEKVEVSEAVTTDNAGGVADCIELTLTNAADWLRWEPQADDKVEIMDAGYKSGIMYIDALLPEDDVYKLKAFSMPRKARERRWGSFEGISIAELANILAAEIGMSAALYGVDESVRYPYVIRQDETVPGMLQRLLKLEGAMLKCFDQKLIVVDLLWAQEREPVRTLEMGTDMAGVKHNKTQGKGYSRCVVKSPYGEGFAIDRNSDASGTLFIDKEPVFNSIQATRYARASIMNENRGNEQLQWSIDFDTSMTGLVRVDIEAPGELGGKWLVEQVKHDHITRKSDCVFLRCMDGIV